MKIYSWKILLITLLAGGAGLVYSFVRLSRGELWGAAWALIFAILMIKGLRISLTEKGFAENEKNEEKIRQIYCIKFGRLASVMPYGGLICFVIAAILLVTGKVPMWIGIAFIVAAPAYEIWLIREIRKEIERKG